MLHFLRFNMIGTLSAGISPLVVIGELELGEL